MQHDASSDWLRYEEVSYEDFDPNDLLIQSYSTTPASNFGPHRIPNGMRVVHLPTGTVVACDEDRSQHKKQLRQIQAEAAFSAVNECLNIIHKSKTTVGSSQYRRGTDITADKFKENIFIGLKRYAERVKAGEL